MTRRATSATGTASGTGRARSERSAVVHVAVPTPRAPRSRNTIFVRSPAGGALGAQARQHALVHTSLGGEIECGVDHRLALQSLALRPAPVDGGIATDREQPRAHRSALRAIASRLAPDGVECILGDLFRGLGTCDHAEQDAKGDATVPVVELAERLGVSRGAPPDA